MGETVSFFINIKHKTFSYKDGNEIIEEGGINLLFLQTVHKSKTTLLLFRKGIYLPTIPNEGKRMVHSIHPKLERQPFFYSMLKGRNKTIHVLYDF
jgi:hypothetical protein